ncbi:MAG: cellulase family glycosylhydrolase [Acidobacteria bacterium]|nr:cellulase family glycosylhydrolase [Acidobacteriota bacterium]
MTTRLCLLTLAAALLPAAEPIRLHPDNPHYFLFRGKPTILLTSGEHYGAVLNAAFDYKKYLDTLAKDGLNMTRIFTGVYREIPNDFGIAGNTLAPKASDFLPPWAPVEGGRFDLTKWNPAYFTRLRDFITEAGKHGIVVEVTLFCPYYRDHMWTSSPANAANNVNGIGAKATSTEVLALKHPDLTRVQEEMTRKIVTELKEFDNVYFELANEPYFAGVTLEFQAHIAKVIREVDSTHLIAQNIANNHQVINKPDPLVSLFNFHYARPPIAVAENWALNKAIGFDETGFDGTHDFVYRIQAWDFLLAGGALYNNLDYSFTVGHEDGTFAFPGSQPGGGGVNFRAQLRILRDFLAQLDFIRMKPDASVLQPLPEGITARALSEPGRQYAVYLHHGRVLNGFNPHYVVRTGRQQTGVTLHLPPGNYTVTWWDPKKGRTAHVESFPHTGSGKTLIPPQYTEDVALIVKAR